MSPSRSDLALLALCSWLLFKFVKAIRIRAKTTQLRGPPSEGWVFGITRQLTHGKAGPLLEKWATEYGGAFQIPTALGSKQIILVDTKALVHFFTKDTYGYTMDTFTKKAVAKLLGKGLIYAEGDSHRRQRRALSSAFTNSAIRLMTPVFYDSVYKAKTAWDAMLDASPSANEAVIDVQRWMSRISLDTIGIAGFDHDFGTLDGKASDVAALFDSFNAVPTAGLTILITLLSPVLPYLWDLPTKRKKLTQKFYDGMHEISEALLERSRKEREAGEAGTASRSIIGTLLKAENADSELNLSPDEVLAQMRVLLLAGYETTSITLTWALIELSLRPEKQDKLRAELSRFSLTDPSYDQLTSELPYLDAVSREILRLHPPVEEIIRVAVEDDVIPLNDPVRTATGAEVKVVHVARGVGVRVPISTINKSETVWGTDAKTFSPERWLEGEQGLTTKAKEIQGYHHLMTFVDGPRICLGRAFAVAEFKAVLSVLIRNFSFSMRDGLETKLDMTSTLLPRPRVAGEKGYALPMRVRRVEG